MPNTSPAVEVRECADAVVVAHTPNGRYLLLGQRGDYAEWALPGGKIDPNDGDVVDAALRELREETGLQLDRARVPYVALPRRRVPDPRTTDSVQYWTTPVRFDIDVDELPTLNPSARELPRVEWVYASTYGTVCQHVEGLGGRIWHAHEQMIRDLFASTF